MSETTKTIDIFESKDFQESLFAQVDAKSISKDSHPNSRKVEVHRVISFGEERGPEGKQYADDIKFSKGGIPCGTETFSLRPVTALPIEEERIVLSVLLGQEINEIYKNKDGHAPQPFLGQEGAGVSNIGTESTNSRDSFVRETMIIVSDKPVLLQIGKTIDNDRPIGYREFVKNSDNGVVNKELDDEALVAEVDEQGRPLINLPLEPLDYLKYAIVLRSPVVAKSEKERYNGFNRPFYIVDQTTETNKKDLAMELEDEAAAALLLAKTDGLKLHKYLSLLDITHAYEANNTAIDKNNYITLRNYVLENVKIDEKNKIIKQFTKIVKDKDADSKFMIKMLVKGGGLGTIGDVPTYIHPETNKTLANGLDEMVKYLVNPDNSEVVLHLKAIVKSKKANRNL